MSSKRAAEIVEEAERDVAEQVAARAAHRPSGVTMDFDERRRKKWRKGRRERGLPDDAPFDGDPAAEGRQECEDLANYADELHHQGRIDDAVRYRLQQMAREIDMLLGAV